MAAQLLIETAINELNLDVIYFIKVNCALQLDFTS